MIIYNFLPQINSQQNYFHMLELQNSKIEQPAPDEVDTIRINLFGGFPSEDKQEVIKMINDYLDDYLSNGPARLWDGDRVIKTLENHTSYNKQVVAYDHVPAVLEDLLYSLPVRA